MTDAPDLTSYYLAHEAMRRGSAQLAAALAGLAETDRRRARTIAWWWDGFAGELRSHHQIEDEIFFPALAARVPTFAHYEAGLARDHAQLDEVITTLGVAVHRLAEGRNWARHHPVAVEQSAELARFLVEHLGVEDDDVLPLFSRHFTGAEYQELDGQVVKRLGLNQLLFTVPWVVTTADPDVARQVLADAPAVVRVVWRLTRRHYARNASRALGTEVPAVVR